MVSLLLVERVFTHVPWVVIMIGVAIKLRRMQRPALFAQLAGALVLSLWVSGNTVVGIVLWNASRHPGWLDLWIAVQGIALPVGMSLFAAGYLVECVKPSRT